MSLMRPICRVESWARAFLARLVSLRCFRLTVVTM